MSSKIFLNKQHTKTKETTWTWMLYILKEFYNFLKVLLLWSCWITNGRPCFFT